MATNFATQFAITGLCGL